LKEERLSETVPNPSEPEHSAGAVRRRGSALRIGALFAGALLVAWFAARVNLDRACALQDTPYLDLCPLATASVTPEAALRARIAASPGDANAYAQLAVLQRGTAAGPGALQAATTLAPTQPNLLLLNAMAALDRQDWSAAVGPLVQLVEYRDVPAAERVLARLVAGGQGDLLAPYLRPGTLWLPRLLAQMPSGQASISSALPLIVRALRAGILDTETIRSFTRQLKAAGAWADAYSLWLALEGGPQTVLFNPGFDQPFQPDGFDWEVPAAGPPSRAGAIVERRGEGTRGAVLDIRFTGRTIALPMVRQTLFLGEGRWRLGGEYMSRQLHVEQGMAWVVHCTAGRQVVGRSEPLSDTGGAWKPFAFEIDVPRGCGLVADLQLETWAPADAALGARGRVAFDAFSLAALPHR
jgi:hypothetical protein